MINEKKILGRQISIAYIRKVKPAYGKKGFGIPKWVIFCEIMMNHGWEIFLYQSRSTVSKYIWVRKGDTVYKVRFSNHRANFHSEMNADCDFYVGVGNFDVMTTEQCIDTICGVNE